MEKFSHQNPEEEINWVYLFDNLNEDQLYKKWKKLQEKMSNDEFDSFTEEDDALDYYMETNSRGIDIAKRLGQIYGDEDISLGADIAKWWKKKLGKKNKTPPEIRREDYFDKDN